MSRQTCDTSVLVPALLAWHEAHDVCRSVLDGVTRIPAHVLVECYSVLTRLPAPHRVAPADASALVSDLPFVPVGLPEPRIPALLVRLGRDGIRGGATYDALVAATAHHHDLELLTRDRRARPVYVAVGVDHTML